MPTGSATFDVDGLDLLRIRHPAWRLLRAEHAPFVISFLHRTFIVDQRRQLPESEVLRFLEDHLFVVRARAGVEAYPRPAREYLANWTSDEAGWLRLSYVPGNDEPVCDLTPAAEQAIEWIGTLRGRAFIGTESRLLTVIELLRQIRAGTETDPAARLAALERRQAQVALEIERIRRGEVDALSPTNIRDRFQLLASNARALLSDLREVQQHFHGLDREARSHIAQWDGAKGGLLEQILGDRDVISDSDQGQSFRAFWDFLMTPERQEEFDALLAAVLTLPAVREMGYDPRLHRIRFDWLAAGEQAQRTVALLSQQLRRFLDDRAWLENRRIAQLIQNVERGAIAVREAPPTGEVMTVDALVPELILPLDRPLFTPTALPVLADAAVDLGLCDADDAALYSQHHVNLEALVGHIRHCLATHEQVTLPEVVARHPLEQGLAELVGYLRLASDPDGLFRASVDEEQRDIVSWCDSSGLERRARLPRITFTP